MSSYEQSVEYSFPDDPGVTLTFAPLDSIMINAAGEIIPKTGRTALTTAGTIDLPVPDDTGRGAWRWAVALPDAELGVFELGHHVGAAQLATLLATYNERTAVSPNVLAQLIARYYSLSVAQRAWLDDGLTAVPDAADLIPDAPVDTTQYARQNGAWAAISSVSDVGDLTTAGLTAANMLRVASGGGLEERTPAQVLADIGAEAAGAAAVAQAAAVQRANHTGTQLLSTISDVTATGSSLATAASVNAARAAIGLSAVAMPPRHIDHMRLTFGAADVAGSGALVTFAGGQWQLASGATANSTYRYRVSDNTICLNYTDEGVSWNRKIEFFGYLRNSEANAEGVFRAFFGKQTTGAFGVANSEYYVALEVLAGVLTNAYVCNGSAAVTVPLTPTALPTPFFIQSENGAVNFYANGVLIGTTTSGPTAANRPASINYEINNGASAANYKIRIWSQSKGY